MKGQRAEPERPTVAEFVGGPLAGVEAYALPEPVWESGWMALNEHHGEYRHADGQRWHWIERTGG